MLKLDVVKNIFSIKLDIITLHVDSPRHQILIWNMRMNLKALAFFPGIIIPDFWVYRLAENNGRYQRVAHSHVENCNGRMQHVVSSLLLSACPYGHGLEGNTAVSRLTLHLYVSPMLVSSRIQH